MRGPVIRRSSEEAEPRLIQPGVTLPAAQPAIQRLRLGIRFEAATLEQNHLLRRSEEAARDREPGGACADDAEVALGHVAGGQATSVDEGQLSARARVGLVFTGRLDETPSALLEDPVRFVELRCVNRDGHHVALLDLWRNVRNTMHNNGLFMPASGKDSSVLFLGNTYDFLVGKPNQFITTEFVVNLLPHMTTIILDVLQSNEVSRIGDIPEIS